MGHPLVECTATHKSPQGQLSGSHDVPADKSVHTSGDVPGDGHGTRVREDAAAFAMEGPETVETTFSVTESQFQCIDYPANMDELLRMRAGPGSGKTFAMVARIAQLLQNGAQPEEILVLSMANKSVDSLRSTLADMVGEVAERVEVSTFHSFCGGLLDQYGPTILPKYTKLKTFDAKTWKGMMRVFLSKLIKFNGHSIGAHITPTKLGNLLVRIFSGKASVSEAARPYGINELYIEGVLQYMSRNGFVRYDELISHAISTMNLAKKGHALLAMPRLANYKYVLVDEFQDIYPLLIRTINAIVTYPTVNCESTLKKHLTIAGDPNQSIYEFLGSNHEDMQNVLEKIQDYHVKDVQIRESFRCTQEILDAATQVCLKGDTGFITTRPHVVQKPVVFQASSEIAEQQFVANEIIRLVCELGGLVQLGDIAILTRSNDSALAMQSLLKTYKLASVKLSQGNLWIETPLHLYKDVLSVVSGDSDLSFSLMSVLQHIDKTRGSSLRIAKIFNRSLQDADPADPLFLESHLFEQLLKIDKSKRKPYLEGLYKNQPQVLSTLVHFLNNVQKERGFITEMRQRGALAYGPVELVASLARLAEVIGIPDTLTTDSALAKRATAREALESFNNSLHHAYSKYVSNDNAMTFLDFFLHCHDLEVPAASSNAINVSTIHSAKGLEFSIVFVLGQTVFTLYWDKILARPEEEYSGQETLDLHVLRAGREDANARLLYVAMTRARNLVYLGCRKRYSELLHTAREYLTWGLPDLRSRKPMHAALAQETLAGPPFSANLPNKAVRLPERTYLQDAYLDNAERGLFASTCPFTPSSESSILAALAHDLCRGVPSQQMLALGASHYHTFSEMRKVRAALQIPADKFATLRQHPNAHAPVAHIGRRNYSVRATLVSRYFRRAVLIRVAH